MKARVILYRAAIAVAAVAAAVALSVGTAQAGSGHVQPHHHQALTPQPNDPEGGPT